MIPSKEDFGVHESLIDDTSKASKAKISKKPKLRTKSILRKQISQLSGSSSQGHNKNVVPQSGDSLNITPIGSEGCEELPVENMKPCIPASSKGHSVIMYDMYKRIASKPS